MHEPASNRRSFLKRSAAAAAAASSLASVAHAAGDETLRVGVVGCGGRGTGAAEQALTADKGTRLVAMGEAFQDRLDDSLSALRNSAVGDRVDVPPERQFLGFDAYKAVIDQCDVALLTSTPHFRPQHIAYAVSKGKHVFAEKPVATDAPGLRSVLQSCAEAKAKNLALVSGFCWRAFQPRREAMQRVRDGAIGKVVAVESTYNSKGVWEPRRTREQCKSEMEYQLRNWYYYTWLSGDHIVEQAIHGLDTMAWALGDRPPIRCFASGGRQVRTDPSYGNIYDHFSVVYEYPDDVRGYHNCRHWAGVEPRVKDYILGAKGICDVFVPRISGQTSWSYRGPKPDMYQAEHDELFASIRAGRPLNNMEAAAHTTLLALMGRMAAYTGEVITWDMAMDSQESLAPAEYAWGDVPVRPVAKPGTTRFA